ATGPGRVDNARVGRGRLRNGSSGSGSRSSSSSSSGIDVTDGQARPPATVGGWQGVFRSLRSGSPPPQEVAVTPAGAPSVGGHVPLGRNSQDHCAAGHHGEEQEALGGSATHPVHSLSELSGVFFGTGQLNLVRETWEEGRQGRDGGNGNPRLSREDLHGSPGPLLPPLGIAQGPGLEIGAGSGVDQSLPPGPVSPVLDQGQESRV
ncbi:unnamed protein product, partial [Discosporangium mesarthrocarpum]